MASFKDSQEHAFRRLVRAAIRKGDFTKGERDVILALVDHWMHHKAKGPIHPGRNKLAKRAGVSVRTVSSTLASLRAAGVLNPVSNLHGGFGTATRYRVNIHALMTLCGCDWLDDFLQGCRGSNCTVAKPEIARLSLAGIAHGINNVKPAFPQSKKKDD